MSEDVKSDHDEGFAAGVVWACARLVQMFDQPTMAALILQESGVDVSQAAEQDVAFLREELPDLPAGKE
jgi:hypothetical protein